MQSESEASLNQGKGVEHSPQGFSNLADSSLSLRMTTFFYLRNISYKDS
jgi:hypothetical protein